MPRHLRPNAFSLPIGLRRIRSGSTASVVLDFSRLIRCGSSSLRPACSTPRLLPTPPRGDAVGAVFGREQFNSTGRTFTCVVTSFTGAHDPKAAEKLGTALGEGFGEALAEAFSGLFSGFMSVGEGDLAFVTKDPKSRIVSMEIQTAAGKKIDTHGYSSSGEPKSRTKVVHYGQPVPDDARLLIYLATEKSVIAVPLQLTSIPLP